MRPMAPRPTMREIHRSGPGRVRWWGRPVSLMVLTERVGGFVLVLRSDGRAGRRLRHERFIGVHRTRRGPVGRHDVGAVGVGRVPGRLLRVRPASRTAPICALFTVSLNDRQVRLLAVQRTHIELYGRWLEEQGRARSTVGRRLSTLAGCYRYCEQESIPARSPAAHVRRPKQDYESRTLGLDRNELGAFLVAAGLSSNRDHALASLLALNGLRISEALGADIHHLNVERGHRTLRILRGDRPRGRALLSHRCRFERWRRPPRAEG